MLPNGYHLSNGADGAIQLGVPTIIICTIPPIFPASYTAPLDTERDTCNTSIRAYAAAHGGDGVVLADLDVTLRDAGNHAIYNPAYLATNALNDAGNTAVFGVLDPLLP